MICEVKEAERDYLNENEQSEVKVLRDQHQSENANEKNVKHWNSRAA